jgi:hypothetical protein
MHIGKINFDFKIKKLKFQVLKQRTLVYNYRK